MKTKLSIISGILLVLFISIPSFAYDLTGMWNVTYRFRGNPMTVPALIVQEGDTFTYDKFLKGTVNGDKYVVPGPIPGPRMDIRVAFLQRDGMQFTASDENNFKGFLLISLYPSPKSQDKMRDSSIKMAGERIKDPVPRIMPTGALNLYVKTGVSFKDPVIFAHDPMGNNLTDKVVKSGEVDTSKPGTYKINYNLTDDDGKKAKELTYTITVVTPAPPTLKLLGDETVTVTKGTLYTDKGIQARNFLNEDVTDKVKVLVNGKEADPNSPAVIITSQPDVSYTIKYTIEDENGKASASRTVMVAGAEDEQSFWSYCFISTLFK